MVSIRSILKSDADQVPVRNCVRTGIAVGSLDDTVIIELQLRFEAKEQVPSAAPYLPKALA
jgi:hypothetical protein